MTNTFAASATCTVSINSDDEKVIYKVNGYIFHTVLLVITLLFVIAIICSDYAKRKVKTKTF